MDTTVIQNTKLVKTSDGERGDAGRTKQYVVQVIKHSSPEGETYIVRAYWGRNDWNTHLHNLQSKVIVQTPLKVHAEFEAQSAIKKKIAKGYTRD